MSFITDLESQLITLQQQGAYRQCLSENRPFDIDLTHNDYLNLSTDASVLNASQANLELSKMGSTGSRLLSGQHRLFDTCERLCADYLGMDSGLVFNSGFQLNSGVIPTLFSSEDLIIADKLCHASLLEGIQRSDAQFKRYRHLDTGHLKRLLDTYRGQARHCLVVTESVFSMDGDKAPLSEIQAIAKQYNALLMVDEAHGFGMAGKTGAGCCEDLREKPDFIVVTFGKACGSFGAFLGCHDSIRSILVNQCRSFIYSTALPLPVMAFTIAAITSLPSLGDRRHQVLNRADYFRTQCQKKGLVTGGDSAIVPLILGSNDAVMSLKSRLADLRIAVSAIRHPTVAKGQERLRLTFHSGLTQEDCDYVLDQL